jgi:hypothetical protein
MSTFSFNAEAQRSLNPAALFLDSVAPHRCSKPYLMIMEMQSNGKTKL